MYDSANKATRRERIRKEIDTQGTMINEKKISVRRMIMKQM